MVSKQSGENLCADAGLIRKFCQDYSRKLKTGKFLVLDVLIEITCYTISQFLGEGALLFSLAKRSGNNPAGPAAVASFMYSIEPFLDSCGT